MSRQDNHNIAQVSNRREIRVNYSSSYRLRMLVLFAMAFCLCGCTGGSKTIAAPKLDPATVAAAAIGEYDTNSDGEIDKKEAKLSALDPAAGWDSDANGKISETEISDRLAHYEKLSPGIQSMTCRVFYRGRPLEGAEVIFEPEAFLGDSVEEGSGTTDLEGVAEMVAEEIVKDDPTLRGIRASLYKVRITHPDVDLAAKYNTDTTLFFELSPIEMIDPPIFKLK